MDEETSGMKLLKKVVTSIKEKAGRYENAKLTSQRTLGQNVKQGWDCSQIVNGRRGGRGSLARRKPKWFCSGRRMRSWRRVWNNKEEKEAL